MSNTYNPFRVNGFNPIKSVDGVSILCPSSVEWELSDVSASDAGRTEDGGMNKNRIGQVRGLKLSWKNISTQEGQKILKAFNPEYVIVDYIDPLVDPYYGYGYKSEFYTGNRTAALYNAELNIWSNISFNLIERYPNSNY